MEEIALPSNTLLHKGQKAIAIIRKILDNHEGIHFALPAKRVFMEKK